MYLDSIFGALQKCFNVARLQLNTKKTEFLNNARKSATVFDIQPPIDSKISDNVKFFGFLLDDKLSFQASSINLCRLLLFLM